MGVVAASRFLKVGLLNILTIMIHHLIIPCQNSEYSNFVELSNKKQVDLYTLSIACAIWHVHFWCIEIEW